MAPAVAGYLGDVREMKSAEHYLWSAFPSAWSPPFQKMILLDRSLRLDTERKQKPNPKDASEREINISEKVLDIFPNYSYNQLPW